MTRAPLLLTFLLACTPDGHSGRTLRVLTASSLQDAFTDIAEGFEQGHPGTEVEIVVAGSHTLAAQVRHGLEADVLASADPELLEALVTDDLAHPSEPLTRNRLMLAVGATAPTGLDLDRLPECRRLVLGDPSVPVGRYADALLDAAARTRGPTWRQQVEERVVSREPDARRVAAKVSLGEADAAVVYATDIRGLEPIQAVELPQALGPTPTYASSTLIGAPAPDLATAWQRHTRSAQGQAILSSHGFQPVLP